MKKTVFAVCASLLLLSGTVCAQAADVDANALLNEYYNNISTDEEGDNTENLVQISGDIYYNTDTDMYSYYVDDFSAYFTSNVMDGMIVTIPVTIGVPSGVLPLLYRNGVLYEGDITAISAVGSYVLRVNDNSGTSRQIFAFSIANENSCSFSVYAMPTGFTVRNVSYNGETPAFTSTSVSLEKEGEYVIVYRCNATQKEYTLRLNIDNTPPDLLLADIEDGLSWGPVDVSDVEPGEVLAVYLNDVKIDTPDVLTKSGKYHLVLSDSAGNTQEYDFTIMVYLNWSGIVICVVLIVMFAAIIVYIVISRKKLRIR